MSLSPQDRLTREEMQRNRRYVNTSSIGGVSSDFEAPVPNSPATWFVPEHSAQLIQFFKICSLKC